MTARSPWLARFGELRRVLHEARRDGLARWGADFADLGKSEPLQAWPPDDQLSAVLAAAPVTRRYAPVAGRDDVREAVARHYRQAIGVPLEAENILLTPGGLGGLTIALLTLTRPGDEVAIPVPYYHGHPSQAELAGCVPRLLPTAGTGWRLAGGALAGLAGARALILANPVNPTTVSYPAADVADILAALDPGTAVIADEVYAEYVYDDGGFASVAALRSLDGLASGERWLVVRSAAKTLGRPGLRIGVLIGPAPLIATAASTAAALTGGASVPAQLALAAGLPAAAAADHVRPYRRRAEAALALAGQLGLAATRPAGTFYLWLAGPSLGQAETAARLAREAGVFVWPGEYFGADGCARVSLSAPAAAIEAGLRRIAACTGTEG